MPIVPAFSGSPYSSLVPRMISGVSLSPSLSSSSMSPTAGVVMIAPCCLDAASGLKVIAWVVGSTAATFAGSTTSTG